MNRNELQGVQGPGKDLYSRPVCPVLDTMNCCLFGYCHVLSAVLRDGGMYGIMSRRTLDTAFDVMGDIILSTAASAVTAIHRAGSGQGAGALLAEKSYTKYKNEFMSYADPSWEGVEEKAEL